MPYATEERIEKYIASPTIKTYNTPKCQSVKKADIGLSLYVFHEAGEYDGIGVSAPCILSIQQKDGVSTLSITDPTHKEKFITVTLDGAKKIISASQKASADISEDATKITFNTAFAHGRRFEIKYE